MGDTRERRPLARIQQPFAENARLDHRAAPQGEPEAWIAGGNPPNIFMKDHADRAVGQRRHRFVVFRQDIAIEVTKVAGILEGEDLATAALGQPVAAGQAFQQNGRIARRIAQLDNAFVAPDAPSA
jgi:hypothetical protein